MALLDMIRQEAPATDKAAETVVKLTADNHAAQARLEAARAAYGNALVDEVEGQATAASVAKLKAEVSAAQDQASANAAALLMAQARQRNAQAATQRSQHAQQWDKSVALADKRQHALDALGRTAEQFAAAWREVLRLNADLYEALPAKPDMDAALLNVIQIETAIRRELLRTGIDWAISYPWGKETLPPFGESYKDAAAVVRAWRGNAMGA